MKNQSPEKIIEKIKEVLELSSIDTETRMQ